MKLNKKQRYALALWLGSKTKFAHDTHSIVASFDEFCDGEIPEWRIMHQFGMAGKLWNVHDRIYVTGYSQGEIGKAQYNKQQEVIDKMNQELAVILSMWE